MRTWVVVCVLVGCSTAESPMAGAGEPAGGNGGTGGILSLYDGGRSDGSAGASGSFPWPAGDGEVDGGEFDAATDPGTDATVEPSCSADCLEPYEVCQGTECRTCTLFADTFERPDGDLGEAEYPVSPWMEVADPPGTTVNYGIVEGSLVRLDVMTNPLDLSTALALQTEGVVDGVRLRYVAHSQVTIAFSTTGLADGLSVRSGAGLMILGAGDTYSSAAAGGSGTFFHEVTVEGTTMTGVVGEDGYPSEGGRQSGETVTHEFDGVVVGDKLVVRHASTYPKLLEVSLERYPCVL